MKWTLLALAIASTAIAQQHELAIGIVGPNQAEIRWPAKPGGYYLEYKTTLPGSAWTALDATATEIGGSFRVSIPLTETARYFRLTTGPNVVFVDATAGDDRSNGSLPQPVASLQRALQLAADSTRKEIRVAKGSYNLNGDTLNLASNVRLLGGYDPADNWTHSPQDETFILGGPVAIKAVDITGASIEGFSIEAAAGSAPGESSYGILAIRSGLAIRNNTISAQRGGDGGSAGGPSAGIFVIGQAQIASNAITHKAGGAGGPGGVNPDTAAAPSGATGASAPVIVEALP